MQIPKVLIVGSGPAGLVLALSLLKNGIPMRIIEKDTQHHSGERGPAQVGKALCSDLGSSAMNIYGASGDGSWRALCTYSILAVVRC